MQTQYFTLRSGIRIHCLLNGNPGNPPLVLLHGYPSNAHLWRKCLPALTQSFYTIVPDMPGFGKSDKPLDVAYDLDFFVDFLEDFFDEVGLEKSALAAHDLGAMAALGFVARHQERVSRFVVLDTAPYPDWPKLLRIMVDRARHPFWARLILTRSLFTWMLRRYLVADPAVVTREVVDIYRAPWVVDRQSRAAFSRVVDAPPERISESVENLRGITAPTLVLWALKDRFLRPSVARRLHADLPNSELVILPDCGHFLQEEQPELVSRHLNRFLTDGVDAV